MTYTSIIMEVISNMSLDVLKVIKDFQKIYLNIRQKELASDEGI